MPSLQPERQDAGCRMQGLRVAHSTSKFIVRTELWGCLLTSDFPSGCWTLEKHRYLANYSENTRPLPAVPQTLRKVCCCSSVTSEGSSVSRSVCPLLWNPMNCSPPGSSVHGILQVRILEWVGIPFSKGSFPLRDQIQVSCTERWILYCLSHQGSGVTLIPGLGLDPSFPPPGLWISEMSIKVPWEAFSICKCPLPPQTHQITNSGDEAGQSGCNTLSRLLQGFPGVSVVRTHLPMQ